MSDLLVARQRLADVGAITTAPAHVLTPVRITSPGDAAHRLALQVDELAGALSIVLDEVEHLHARVDQLERRSR